MEGSKFYWHGKQHSFQTVLCDFSFGSPNIGDGLFYANLGYVGLTYAKLLILLS